MSNLVQLVQLVQSKPRFSSLSLSFTSLFHNLLYPSYSPLCLPHFLHIHRYNGRGESSGMTFWQLTPDKLWGTLENFDIIRIFLMAIDNTRKFPLNETQTLCHVLNIKINVVNCKCRINSAIHIRIANVN